MGGEEDTILKHQVKARDKNHLTNKKPKHDIMGQDRIPIPWIEANQAKKNTRPLERTKLQVY